MKNFLSALLFTILTWLSVGATTAPALRTQPGWRAELVAQAPEVKHPSVVCTAPDGRVFVAEDPMDITSRNASVTEGRILCLHPDGARTVFATNLHGVFGMQYLEGRLYVLHNPTFTVFTDDRGIGRSPVNLIEQTLPEPWAGDWNDHVPANFRLGMDGFFYIAVGDKGLHGAVGTDGRRADLNGGGLARIRPDGTGLEVIARGNRNILDLALDAEDEMFTYDNTDEHNWMGRVTHMVDGGEYGYPHNFVPQRPYTLWMFADYGAGAACGALVWNNEALPASLRGNLVLADFGQRNLRRVELTRRGGSFVAARDEELVLEPPSDFRPVGIHETPDGTGFFVCDWQAADSKAQITVGRLWKFTLTNVPPAVVPDWWPTAAAGRKSGASDAALFAGLEHPLRSVRQIAQRELARRRPGTRDALEQLALNESATPKARWHALWALPNDARAQQAMTKLAVSPALSVRRQALRWLGEQRVLTAREVVEKQLAHDDRSIRLRAATALGRIAATASVPTLLAATADDDLFTRFAAFTALSRIGQADPTAWPAIVGGLQSDNARLREATGFALRENFALPLVQALSALPINSGPASRAEAVRALGGLVHQPPGEWKWWFYHPALSPAPARTRVWDGTEPALASLRGALGDDAPTVREPAALALGQARDFTAAEPLRRLFQSDPVPAVRRAALGALAGLEDSETAPLLVALLRDGTVDPQLWREAVERSSAFRQSEVEAALIAALRPPTSKERAETILNALGVRKTDIAVTALKNVAGTDGALRPAALAALGKAGTPAAVAALRSLATQPDAAVVRALAATRQRDAVPGLVAAWAHEITREAAFAGLLDLPDIRALDLYLDGLASPQAALRDKSRGALTKLASEIWPRLRTRTTPLPAAVIGPLRRVLAGNVEALASALLTEPTDGRPVFTPEDYRVFALAHPGDPWRGQQVFFDTRTGCVNCHAVAEHGRSIGPDLTTAGAQFGAEALIESVLYPSKSVREGYQQVELELKDGESLSGAIRGESPENLILVDALGASQTVPKSTVKSRTPMALSLMPEGLHAALSREEFADLIAYVGSLKADPRRAPAPPLPAGFTPLFNGRDLAGWKLSPHWSAKDGVLEHDGVADHLWSTREFGDVEFLVEWRWPGVPEFAQHPVINADGNVVQGRTERVLEAGDSGVLFRGLFKAQANLFCYPVGSGEFWEYRESLPGAARRAVTPKIRADRPLGQWNEMRVKVAGSRVTVVVNGQIVIEDADLPGLPARGPVGFQHEHGRIQFRTVAVREGL